MKKKENMILTMMKLFPNSLEWKEYTKLYDKKHGLELSHNRKVKLLKQCLYFLENNTLMNTGLVTNLTNNNNQQQLIGKIKNELENPYLRHNWGYYHKQEPGHYCGD